MISAVASWNTFTDNYFLTFTLKNNEESSWEEKIIMNDDMFVCNICLALTQFVSSLTSKPYG